MTRGLSFNSRVPRFSGGVPHRPAIVLVSLLIAFVAGCGSMATRNEFYEPITAKLRLGEFEQAVAALEKAKESDKYGKKDRLIYFLDAGFLNYYAGNHEQSNQKLHIAESTAEELATKSISKAALSLVLNDNALEYSGEDYEVLYSNLIGALNYLALDNFDEAFVEVKKANLKLELLEQKYIDMADQFNRSKAGDSGAVEINYEADKIRFSSDAFARYLSMHMYAADGKPDDARLDFEMLEHAFEIQPHLYPFELPSVKYQPEIRDSAILSVVAMAGLAPTKEPLNLRIRTDKDLDLVQILYTDGDSAGNEYSHLALDVGEDYYFKFSLPYLRERQSSIGHVRVWADSVMLGELHLIEDVTMVAKETFQARKSLIYLRTVARAVAKGLVNHKAKKKADTGGLGGWLKKAAIDVATDLTENADLRSSQFLPGRIFVRDFELPAGVYDLRIEYYTPQGDVIVTKEIPEFEVRPRGWNLAQAAWAG